MPTLHWVGKDKVVNHHHEVPFRVLNKESSFSALEGTQANTTANRIIHGDNLEALKSLMPELEGKVQHFMARRSIVSKKIPHDISRF